MLTLINQHVRNALIANSSHPSARDSLKKHFSSTKAVAEYFGIPERTAHYWYSHDRVPKHATRLMDIAAAGYMPCSQGWEKFRIYRGVMYTPEGQAVTPEELKMICKAFDLPEYKRVKSMLIDRYPAKVPEWLTDSRIVQLNHR